MSEQTDSQSCSRFAVCKAVAALEVLQGCVLTRLPRVLRLKTFGAACAASLFLLADLVNLGRLSCRVRGNLQPISAGQDVYRQGGRKQRWRRSSTSAAGSFRPQKMRLERVAETEDRTRDLRIMRPTLYRRSSPRPTSVVLVTRCTTSFFLYIDIPAKNRALTKGNS